MLTDNEFKILKAKIDCIDEQLGAKVSTAGGKVGPITSPSSGVYPSTQTDCGCGNNNVVITNIHTDDNCNDSRTDDRSDTDNGLGIDIVGNKPKNKIVTFGRCGDNSFGDMFVNGIWNYRLDQDSTNGLNLGSNSLSDVNDSKESYISLSNNSVFYTTNGGKYWENLIPDCLNLVKLEPLDIKSDIGQTNIYVSDYYYNRNPEEKVPLNIEKMTALGGMANCSCIKNDLYGLPVLDVESHYSIMMDKELTIPINVTHNSTCDIYIRDKDENITNYTFNVTSPNVAVFKWTPTTPISPGIYSMQIVAHEATPLNEYGVSCITVKILVTQKRNDPYIFIPETYALDNTSIKIPVYIYGFKNLGKIILEFNTVDTIMKFKGLSDNKYDFDDYYIPYDADKQENPEMPVDEEVNKGTIILTLSDSSCNSTINIDDMAFYLEFELNLDNQSFYDSENKLINYIYTSIVLNMNGTSLYDNEGSGSLTVTGDRNITSLAGVTFLDVIRLGELNNKTKMLYLGTVEDCYILLTNFIGTNDWEGVTKIGVPTGFTLPGDGWICYISYYNPTDDSYNIALHNMTNLSFGTSHVISEDISKNYIMNNINNITKRYLNITSYEDKIYLYGKFITDSIMCNVATYNTDTATFTCVYDQFSYGYCSNLVVNKYGIYMVKNLD